MAMVSVFPRSLFPAVLLVSCALASEPAVTETPAQRPDPARFAGVVAAFKEEQPEKGGIVFTGSSSIRRWPDLEGDFSGLPVLNRGFGGSVANDLVVHFEEVVASAAPKLLVTYTGANDLHAGLTVEESFDDYTKFLLMAKERFPGLRVVLTSVKIAPVRAADVPRVHELNGKLEEWAEKQGWVRYVDCTSGLVDEAGDFVTGHFVEDMLHLSESGYAQWREILEPVVREEWEKVNRKEGESRE